ncbi:Ubiquitin carboxyl-terminal hydrolase 22 [Galdieria sulphuraria]|nr:Ubiquitin carboxyl-terminal hydrolase 22 [Galdieria sulphuraria]
MEISLEPNSQLAQHNCPHQKTLRGDKREAARWGIQTAVTLLTYQWNNLQQPLLLCCCNMRDPHICFIDGFLCLSCVYLLCRKESHILEHRQLSGHSLFFDMSFLRMYCFDCKDYVADQLSSSIISSICRLDWTKKTRQVLKKASLPPTVKRQLLWIPSQQELEWIKEYSVSPDEKESTLFPYPGLCGLLNLGNSCYMNAILQVMLHTLPLKRYFLSDSHRSTCSFSRNIQECAACALDDLFMKGFHESFEKDLSEREALSPQFILEIIWRHCDSLASYAQHDAHEFFITFVNVLRQHIICEDACPKKERNGMKVNGREVIDHLFSGVIESHVYCGGCKRYSATLEDYFDISLDLNHSSQMEKEEMECNESVRTLQECLTYFTSPEELDNGTTRYCDYCQQHTSFYKRVAIQRLPQILCFHLKRFQHGLDGKGVSSKIESEIGFPIRSLDMSRYISSEILERNDLPQASPIGVERDDEEDIQFKSISKAKKDDEISSSFIQNDFPLSESKEYLCSRSTKEQLSELNDGSNMNTSLWNIQSNYNEEEIFYDLYAVVNHIGKMDHGHYITWIREQNTWLKCDDEVISVEPFSTESVASSSQAYLLFYISRKCG